MDSVVVRRVDKESKVLMPTGASVLNRSTTPPKVQFIPSHVNIWAPQAQHQLLHQNASKSSRPQSAVGTVRKGLPLTATILQTANNIKNNAASGAHGLTRPATAPILTFSRPDSAEPHNRPNLELPNPQRPITQEFRSLHLGSLAQHVQKRPLSSQPPDRASKFISSVSHQKHAEIETFDSGGDSDTDTFAHTKLATTSSASSRPSSSSSKHRQQSKPNRPNFGMPASASEDVDQRKSEIFDRFSKHFVRVEDFAMFAGKTRFRSPGVKLEAALLERLQSITHPNARAAIFAELFEDVISKDVAYCSVLRQIKTEYDALITPTDPSELAIKYHQLLSTHRVTIADLNLARQEVMQLQELLSAARAEVQIRGENIQILEQNLAARRRRDIALTIVDDEGQTVMESMRRQVEYLTLENERLQSQLKEALASADSPGAGNWNDDEDGDGMQRAADLSTLTMEAQRPSSARISRKAQGATSFVNKTAIPSVHAAPLLQFTPGAVQPAEDKYASDFDFSLKPQQQQPPVPPPLPIYNGEILQAPHSIVLHTQSSKPDTRDVNSSKPDDPLHTPDRHCNLVSAVRAPHLEPSITVPAATNQSLHSSAHSHLKQKIDRPSSAAAARTVPPIAASIVQAAEVALASSADRVSDHSANSERSTFSDREANEGYDEVPELTHGSSMRRGVRPDSVPPLTVEAANQDAAAKDNDDTDSEQSYSYLTTDGERWKIDLSPTAQNLLQ